MIKTDIPALGREHDNRHRLAATDRARESLVYMIQIPEEDIGGFLYTWVNGTGKAGAAVCLFGSGIGEEPIFELCDGIAVPDDMDFHNWQVGGLQVQLKDPLQSVSAFFKSDKVSIEYHFDGLHPAYAYSTHENGCPAWIADDRFEQQGRVQGSVTIGERKLTLDGYGQRDHSWGTRDWGVNQHWKWVHAQAGDELGVHFWELFALGRSHLCGYVNKGGILAQVASVKVKFHCAEGLRPHSLAASIRDSLGRETALEANTYAVFPFHVHELITLFESPLSLNIDGNNGQGWIEMMWPNDLIGYMQARRID